MIRLLYRVHIIGLIMISIGLSAQNRSGVVATDSLPPHLQKLLRESTSRLFYDPEAPRFAIIDKTGNYLFGIGGYVGIHAYFDLNGLDNRDFAINQIDAPKDHDSYSIYGMNATRSRLYFKVLGNTSRGRVEAYMETDFRGVNNSLRLRHAYVHLLGLTVGHTFSVFLDDDMPSGIDFYGVPSSIGKLLPTINYEARIDDKSKLKIGVEVSKVTSLQAGNIVDVVQKFPEIPIVYEYEDDKFHLFAGINTRLMNYREYSDIFTNRFTFATQLSGRMNLSGRDKIYLQFVYADGMVDVINDLSGVGFNLIISPDRDRLYTITAYGLMAAYQYRTGRGGEINLIYSRSGALNLNDNLPDTIYKTGQYAAVNYIRRMFDNARIGVEGVYGVRKNRDGTSGDNFRINALLRYDF